MITANRKHYSYALALFLIAAGAMLGLGIQDQMSSFAVTLKPRRAPARNTVGGCFNELYPYITHGGIRRHNSSHIVVLATLGTNLTELLLNLTCQTGTSVILSVEAFFPHDVGDGEHATPQSSSGTATCGESVVTSVVWTIFHSVAYHDMFNPVGIFGQHALLVDFAERHHVRHPYQFHSMIAHAARANASVAAQYHYKHLFQDDHPDMLLSNQSVWRPCGYLLLMHHTNLQRQFWSLPHLNCSVKLAQERLLAHNRQQPPPSILDKHVFVEKRRYEHRANHSQLRGYRPAVWNAIRNMAKHQDLVLDIVDMMRLSFHEQLVALHSREYIISTEGSFSVWIPFLRKGTICITIYDHYGSGWHIPQVHLPVALLGNAVAKVVFMSLFNFTVPSEDVFRNIFFREEPLAQVTVVTVPSDAAFEKTLATPRRDFRRLSPGKEDQCIR